MIRAIACPYFRRPRLDGCVPIGGLGGLIGLGGGEFPAAGLDVRPSASTRAPAVAVEPADQPGHAEFSRLAVRSGAVSLAAVLP